MSVKKDDCAAVSEPLSSPLESHPVMRGILADYVADLPMQATAMVTSLARKDFDTLRRLTHQLVGAGGSYGFPELSRVAASAEKAIVAKAAIESIACEVQSVIAVLRRVSGYDRVKELGAAA